MSIPLDKIYYYIECIAKEVESNVIIYQFYPHGSKKIEDLSSLRPYDWATESSAYHVICNDQEPLCFDFYQNTPRSVSWAKLLSKYNCYENRNLAPYCIFDQRVLIHSEKQSIEVAKYQAMGFIPVYYWSHAVIALDWFRYAQHQKQQKQVKKTFLIYNRAWSGTREYRLKFAEMLAQSDLITNCHTYLNCVDPETNRHYLEHKFINPTWRPTLNLDTHFEPTSATSNSSANYEIRDYESSEIEVVLETLFDDSRIHLTEKILRPIACGQPFILVGTQGSLDYLREYGFKTFDSVWDEQYDNIEDPNERMKSIIAVMKNITSWSPEEKAKKLCQVQEIADFNKQHFFSKEFFKKIDQELKHNLQQGLQKLVDTSDTEKFLRRRILLSQHKELKNLLTGRSQSQVFDVLPADLDYENNYIMNTKSIMKVLLCARKKLKNLKLKMSH